MERIIRPPQYLEISTFSWDPVKLIFLGGPIQGTKDWQTEAIEKIHNIDPSILIANPRRVEKEQGKYSDSKYNQQVDWETYWIEKAREKGVVMFWLARETNPIDGRTYAQTTRDEIAVCRTLYSLGRLRALVVGIEYGFSGDRYQVKKFGDDCPKIPIHYSLAETCMAAADLAIKVSENDGWDGPAV